MNWKTRLKYAMYMALLRPLSWLPLPALYAISSAMRLIVERVIKYRRRVIRENLRSCYPDKTEQELRKIEHDFYGQFCDNIVETVKLLCISDRTIMKRLEVKGAELIEKAADGGHPVILYLGHYCNWEWVPAITLYYDRPKVNAQLYKPLHDHAFDRVMLRARSRFGSISIDKDKAFREMLRLRRDVGPFVTGFIADHRTSTRQTRYYTEFLRHLTWFYPGGEEIGRRIGAEFIYLDVSRIKRGHYRFEFKPIIVDETDTEYPVTRQYLRMMQQTIDRAPAYWLWSHRRWLSHQSAEPILNNSDNNNQTS